MKNLLSEKLSQDLRTDTVLTLGQIRRRYAPGSTEEEVRSAVIRLAASGIVHIIPAWVPLTARSRTALPVTFVSLRPVRLPPPSLRHLCGVAEMRWRMKDRLKGWRPLAPGTLGDTGEPDAVGEDARGLFAVEYDAGSYNREQVIRKRQAFLHTYGRQVWGAPHPERCDWLLTLLPDAEVLMAPWF